MLLRNFDQVMTAFMLSTDPVNTTSIGLTATNGSTTVQLPTGSTANVQMRYTWSSGSTVFPPIALNTNTICLGTGTTPVTYEDYKLAGSVVTNSLASTSNTVAYDSDTKRWTRTLVATYSNTGTSAITISEWGIFRMNGTASLSYGYSNTSQYVCLVFREVLETPVVIEPNTIATLTFTLEVPAEVNAF